MKLLEFAKAPKCFNNVLESSPIYPEAYKCPGVAYHQINLYQKAEAVFRKGLEILPQHYQLRKHIIDLFLEQW